MSVVGDVFEVFGKAGVGDSGEEDGGVDGVGEVEEEGAIAVGEFGLVGIDVSDDLLYH